MRVIAGSAKGHRLSGPPSGSATRPTTDKVREAIFNILADLVVDARVLDLFAGTGALGIEALSRGAKQAVFVEADRATSNVLRENLQRTHLQERGKILQRDVRRAGSFLAEQGPFDLVFADPPYGFGLEREALMLLHKEALLAPGALVLIEHSSRDDPPEAPETLEQEETRTWGDTSLTLYRVRGEDSSSNTMTRIGIYPGTFDPLTNGHLDVIQRSLQLFDKLIVALAVNVRKQPLFSIEERIEMIKEVVDHDPRVEVDVIEGLLVEYARRKSAVGVIRGIRTVTDFEYEFQMAAMNRKLCPELETVFLMTREDCFYLSSSLVKEVASLGGKIDEFVPSLVAAKLRTRLPPRT